MIWLQYFWFEVGLLMFLPLQLRGQMLFLLDQYLILFLEASANANRFFNLGMFTILSCKMIRLVCL